MGLPNPALKLIVREHKRKAFTGPVLTLGRQYVFDTLEGVQQLLIAENISPAILPSHENTLTNVPNWIGTPNEKNTSDVIFFKLLGLTDIHAMDYSDFENADIVHDLNTPVPDEFKNRFDLIVDGGTIEHVFDIKQDLINIATMLRPGGRIIHMTPMNNYVNHGFYQFSPTLFFDYYGVNAFADLRGYLVDSYWRHAREPWELFELTPTAEIASDHFLNAMLVAFWAEKTPDSTVDKVPLQSVYQQMYQKAVQNTPKEEAEPISQATTKGQITSKKAPFRQWVPMRIKAILNRGLGFLREIWNCLNERIWDSPHYSHRKKPWGLKRVGRL